MGMEKADIHDALAKRRTFGKFEDFTDFSSGGMWTSVLNGAASIAVNDGSYGLLTMSSIDSTQDRELYLRSTTALFTFQAGRPFVVEARLQFAEASTNNINVAFGVANSVANGLLVNSSAGPKTSGTFAMIYKQGGTTTNWKTASSVSTTQNLSTSTLVRDTTNFHTLRIDVMPVSTTIAEITYYVDDIQLQTSGGRPGQSLIKDQLTYTGAANMQLFLALKNGTTAAEVLTVDYLAWEYLRGVVYGTTG